MKLITKNQSGHLKNIKPSLSCSSIIFKMAAAEEVECVDEHMHPDINELLSKGIHRYTILYDKTLKEAKDHKMKSNAWKKITFPVTQPKLFGKVIILAIGSSCFLLKHWAYPNFSWRSCLVLETFSSPSYLKKQHNGKRQEEHLCHFVFFTGHNVVMSMFTFAT